jgi:D-3-phosphoglycerate dehydrogenase
MKILIIDEMHLSIIPLMENAGYIVDYRPEIDRPEIENIIKEYVGLIIRSKTPMDKPLLGKAVNLRFIARAGAGLDKIDLKYLEERDIKLFHAAEGNKDAVGEQAIGMLLCLFNHISRADQEVRKGIWRREENRGVELQGKTFGIIGYGNMGEAIARKLSGFDVNILAYDKYKSGFGTFHVTEVGFKQLQAEADIVSMHVPLTHETRNFLTMEVIEQFAKPFYFINTARGEIISFETLNAAMDKGIILGAVLDVMENEKFSTFTKVQKIAFGKLAARENVVFSPHIAGWTYQSYEKINQVLVEKIVRGGFI